MGHTCMNHQDKIYGSTVITEPVLEALMESASMQRLQGVLQHGITGLIGVTTPVSRFDHSVGAMLLVRRLGASLKEQVAALLHDVSHTAFSHVIDYVFDSHDSQSYHDEQKETYVAHTELPQLLSQYGYDWRELVHEEDFPLLEQPAPRLCADRLDYFLRDSQDLGLATTADIQFALDHLVVAKGRIATDNIPAAQWLATTYIQADDASWSNFREVGLYELTAQAIKRGLATGAIGEGDFWQTDKPLWQALKAHEDAELQAILSQVSTQTEFAWDEEEPTFWVSTKIRSIDPDVVVDGVLRPLSTLDPQFAQYRADYHQRKAGKWPMRVVIS